MSFFKDIYGPTTRNENKNTKKIEIEERLTPILNIIIGDAVEVIVQFHKIMVNKS